ncbi:MAG: ADP-ribosylglycohydrolase family protein [Candidatus Helarchaeota archaeon]
MNVLDRKEYYDRVYGSWLGRCIGSALGAPLEFRPYWFVKWRHPEITHYVKPVSGTVYNDDEMYEIVGLLALERHGIDLTSEMIGKEWLNELYTMMYTAEKVAYKNMKKGMMPPLSGKKENNVYFDFIGAQMKADLWGQIAPCPEVAAKYARIDGEVAHSGDGILGEVFIAVLISLSFFNSNVNEIVEQALKYVPAESKYAQMIECAVGLHSKHDDWRMALKDLKKFWKKMKKELLNVASFKRKLVLKTPFLRLVHVLPNAGIIALSLLYGGGDFQKSICIAAMSAMDTDCNCGNVGAILGTQLGAMKIPARWKDPLKDSFKTKTRSVENVKISELARRVCRIGEQVIEKKCKEVQLTGNYKF